MPPPTGVKKRRNNKRKEEGNIELTKEEEKMGVEIINVFGTTKKKYFTKKRVCSNLFYSGIYYYILILIAFMDVMFGPLFTILAGRTHSSIADMGWIVTVGSLGNVIGTPIGSYLFHKYTRYDGDPEPGFFSLSINLILFLNTIIMVLCVYPTTFITNYWLLLSLQLILACSHAVGDVGANFAIGIMWREKVYPFLQLLHCCETFGYVIAPLITSQIFELVNSDVNQLFSVCTFITFMIILAFFPLVLFPSPTSPKPDEDTKEQEQQQEPEEEDSNNNIVVIRRRRKKSRFSKLKNMAVAALKKIFTIHTLVCVLIGLVKGVETDFYQEFGNMIFSYGEENHLGSEVSRSYLLSCFWAVMTFSRFLSVFLVMFMGDAVLILFALSGNVLTFSILYVFNDSYTVYWLGSLSHAFFVAPLTAACFSFPQSFFGDPMTSYSVGVIDFVCAFGMVSPFVNLMWYTVPNALYLAGIFVFSGLLVIMIVLGGLRVFVDCKKSRRSSGQKCPILIELKDMKVPCKKKKEEIEEIEEIEEEEENIFGTEKSILVYTSMDGVDDFFIGINSDEDEAGIRV